MTDRSYSELIRLRTFEDRYNYLRLSGSLGTSTFGYDRYINQKFYASTEWKQIRNHVIVRDNGCDLGVEGYDVFSRIMIHHMNPISVADLVAGVSSILDPEFLIVTTHNTHNAIHYGDSSLLNRLPAMRYPGDTKLW